MASTDLASSAHTDLLIPSDFSVIARKTAHLVEYAVLGILAVRALRMLFPSFVRGVGCEVLRRMAIAVIPFGILVAATDEFHQSWVPSRKGSGWDVLIDTLGLLAGLAVMWLVWRHRTSRTRRIQWH